MRMLRPRSALVSRCRRDTAARRFFNRPRGLLSFALSLLCFAASAADDRPSGWAVASAHPAATNAAYWIAEQGGNAFDAAVAVTATLGVVEPMGSGIGGGGFWLIHRARDGFQVMIDGRERAPLAASKDMYLDQDGQVVPGLSLDGPLAAGIPGEPAALAHLAEKYGRLPLATSLQPAIEAAAEGFRVAGRFRRLVEFRRKAFNKKARQLFLTNGDTPADGTLVRQPELAATMREMAAHGRDGFYAGWVASTLVSEINTAGGIWTQQDLMQYRVVERPPVTGTYRGARFVAAALPSSGGVVLSQILNMLGLREAGQGDQVDHVHYTVEAMRRAYRDRARYLGDPDFVDVDQVKLTSVGYARELVSDLSQTATPSAALAGLDQEVGEGTDTSHFSIIDEEGNRVSATLSINYPFGSGFVSAATGVVLNNEMDDFVSKPGVANVYGLVGGSANAIAPGKRPLSSMSPTFVETEEIVAVIGTPGGSRIISMVLLAMLELIDNRQRDLQRVVDLPRYHHQFLPDHITYEPGALGDDVSTALQQRGHRLKERTSAYGDMHAVLWDRVYDRLSAASDGRGEGLARVW